MMSGYWHKQRAPALYQAAGNFIPIMGVVVNKK